MEKYRNQHQMEEQQNQVAEPQTENSERGISVCWFYQSGFNCVVMAHYVMQSASLLAFPVVECLT